MQFVSIYISGCMEKLYILILYKLPNPLVIAAKLTVFEPVSIPADFPAAKLTFFEPAPTLEKRGVHFAKQAYCACRIPYAKLT